MASPPSPNIRLTITVSQEVHDTFKRLAEAGNMSLSRCMGEWLGDTREAAEFMAQKMVEARAAPKVVMREMHAYALGLADETSAMLSKMSREGVRGTGGQPLGARPVLEAPSPPRPVIRGGKSPSAGKRGRP